MHVQMSGEQVVSSSPQLAWPFRGGAVGGGGALLALPTQRAMCVCLCYVCPRLPSDPIQELIFPALFSLHLGRPLS